MKMRAAQRDSDIRLLSMFDDMLSDGEREKLRELRELAARRSEVRICSMREARDMLDRAKAVLDDAIMAKPVLLKLYEEAVFTLAEDEDDDWEVAKKKADKFERIESDYLAADQVIRDARKGFDFAMRRVQWELREAERMGFIRDGDAGK